MKCDEMATQAEAVHRKSKDGFAQHWKSGSMTIKAKEKKCGTEQRKCLPWQGDEKRSMSRFTETLAWKLIRTALELIVFAVVVTAIVIACGSLGVSEAVAEEWDEHEEEFIIAYAICAKGDHVNVREYPNNKQEPAGRLDPGDMVYLDGKKSNGYWHCVGIGTESGDGWVHKGYIVFDEPELVDCNATIVARGRLAARKNVNGRRTRWLKPGASLKVWYRSDEWCSTNCGYVQTKYLELEGE